MIDIFLSLLIPAWMVLRLRILFPQVDGPHAAWEHRIFRFVIVLILIIAIYLVLFTLKTICRKII